MRGRIFALHVLGPVLAGLVWPAGAATLSAKEEAAGRKLYVNKCAKCHKFYDPAKYSEAQWQRWMSKMAKKAKLERDEAQLLLRYLEEKYRSSAGVEGKGASGKR